MADPSAAEGKPQELRRVMGPGLLLLFIIGDIMGTGVYALTGDIAGEVGGAAWLPFLVAFAIALVTAFSYLELVTKYPHAAGAALYVHKAFGIHFVTFLVAFVVMCAGITSASTASRFFSANLFVGLKFSWGTAGIVGVALLFMALLAAINLRGVGQSVKLNVVLTVVEVTGLMLVIFARHVGADPWRRCRLLPRYRLRHRPRQERVSRGDHSDLAGLFCDGRL